MNRADEVPPGSVSGLTRAQRHLARDQAVQAALLMLKHPREIHYSQGPHRWDGIAHRLDPRKGEFPKLTDCSGSVSWILWAALHLTFGLPDIVNGERWKAGYTGTLGTHGRAILHTPMRDPGGHDRMLHADLVLYGSAWPWDHVTMMIGRNHAGTPLVFSQGSDPGPFILPYNYRDDVGEIRRYI